jgi:transcriptional antiterminator RfaH
LFPIDSWQQTRWFVVHTKPRRESYVTKNIHALGPEVFFPQLCEEKIIRRRRQTVTKPLFAGYLFARFSPHEALDSVRHARGVLRVLSTGRMPIPLAEEVISGLRERCASDGFVHREATTPRPGDYVEIQEGPFAGWIGRVERECNDMQRVALLLEAIQARLLVEKGTVTRVAA